MNVELKLTKEEYNLVIAGLMELPAKKSMVFVLKLDQGVNKQLAEAEKKKLKKVD